MHQSLNGRCILSYFDSLLEDRTIGIDGLVDLLIGSRRVYADFQTEIDPSLRFTLNFDKQNAYGIIFICFSDSLSTFQLSLLALSLRGFCDREVFYRLSIFEICI